VLALVDSGLAFLEKHGDERLGGKCLIALAFLKRGASPTHPRIQEALAACRDSVEAEKQVTYIYGKALAVIFLAELDAAAYRDLLRTYAGMLDEHQKDHGGFGYINMLTGDTSQTQYTALAFWEMLNHGISPDAQRVQRCLNWLMRTQDPSGVWGYQGQDPGSLYLTEQLDRPGRSMAAAGMGSTMILGNALGLLTPGSREVAAVEGAEELPPALRRSEQAGAKRAPALPAGDVDPNRLAACLDRGRRWYQQNFSMEVDEFQCYYLYSVERYKSFEEYLEGGEQEEPPWYNAGYEFLKRTQKSDGSWLDECGAPCATAFAGLFLLRSTQLSIKASLGEGTLVGGRGLPRDLSKVKLRGGKLVVQYNPTELDELLDMLDENEGAELDALLDDPAALIVDAVGAEQGRRLQQVARSGTPEARWLAVRALAKSRRLDFAPTLIYALTDPDKRVVREARDGLRYLSRSFEGFGPPDNFDESQRDQAIVHWKEWYNAVRPDAALP
jgi:hypothetical protein